MSGSWPVFNCGLASLLTGCKEEAQSSHKTMNSPAAPSPKRGPSCHLPPCEPTVSHVLPPKVCLCHNSLPPDSLFPPQPLPVSYSHSSLNWMHYTSVLHIFQRLLAKDGLNSNLFYHGFAKYCFHLSHFPCREVSRSFLNSNRTPNASTEGENSRGEDGWVTGCVLGRTGRKGG